MFSKDGRVALVSGAAAGIGQAMALRLAEDGADIVVLDLADGSETVRYIQALGRRAMSLICDVASPEEVHQASASALGTFGKIDILVHCAGIYPIEMFQDISFDSWKRVMSVNLDSCFHLCHELLPGMPELKYGRVVCFTSNSFHPGAGGLAHYVASKGGVIGFVRSLAAEIGEEGITVNAIAPTLTRTKGTTEGPHDELQLFEIVAQLQAIKRTGQPEDLAGAVSFLTSDDAAFITGQTLVVDGGWIRA